MKLVLFCENKYAIDILLPIQEEAEREKCNEVLWYIHRKKIPDFPYKDKFRWTNSIQEVYDFHPDAIFVPGNIVPYYLPGVKVQIFHGYAAEKKDHWVIRRYFDLYLTQGPYFTSHFKMLAEKYKDFEVMETGWPRQDWIFRNRHSYDSERERLLKDSGCSKIVLYAPTFSPKLTSLPYMKEELVKLSEEKNALVLLKFHPLTRQEWIDEYKQLADEHKNIVWIDDFSLTKYILMSDILISDTSSSVYEGLLLDKPVITLNTIAKDIYWYDIRNTEDTGKTYDLALGSDPLRSKREWIIRNYDPYLDGKVGHRMLEAVRDYIRRHGVPEKRRLNLWRKYTSIKTFGKINK